MAGTMPQLRRAYYDDQDLNYLDYWTNRGYEHDAEVMAVRRLLSGRRFDRAVDIGGGYGRLSVVLADYASHVTLVDASQQQLDLARAFLSGQPRVDCKLMDASALQFPDRSADLVSMVRVLHHLPDPTAELRELHRILRPGGYAVVEVANGAHAVNRLRYLARGQSIPRCPVDIRATPAREGGGIPFVNHHPATVVRQLRAAGLNLERTLSVSNLRSAVLKRWVPKPRLLAIENALQERAAPLYFGPSIFLLLRRGGKQRT